MTLWSFACGGRPGGTDRTGVDMGTRTDGGSDGGATDGGGTDGAGGDGASIDAMSRDGSTLDGGARDLGFDAGGESCGTSVCTTGFYCCAASCNLCLPDSMFCLADPCSHVDAGPPRDAGPHDAGTDLGTMTGDCRTTGCGAPSHCDFCGASWICLPPGVVCVGPPIP